MSETALARRHLTTEVYLKDGVQWLRLKNPQTGDSAQAPITSSFAATVKALLKEMP